MAGATSVDALRESSAWMAREERERLAFDELAGAGSLAASCRLASPSLGDMVE